MKIQAVAVEMIQHLRGPLGDVERGDRDLGRQLRRAAASVVLNMGEGSGSTGCTRREHVREPQATGLSMGTERSEGAMNGTGRLLGRFREVQACQHVAVAFGYVREVGGPLRLCVSQVSAGLLKLT